MERRVLLAVFLSFLVLYMYQALFVPPPPEPPRGAPDGAPPPAAEPAPSAIDAPLQPLQPVPLAADAERAEPDAVDDPAPSEPVIGETAAREIVVETDHVRAVFTNRGAQLTSWQLKEYLDDGDTGEPVELVPRDLPPGSATPFAVELGDERLTRLANAALYRASAQRLSPADRPETLTFEYEDASGLRVRKTFTFDPGLGPYQFITSIEASDGGQPLNAVLRWGPALGGVERSTSGFAFRQGPRGVLEGLVLENGVMSERDVWRPDAGDVSEQSTYQGQLGFVGVDNHYFLAAALPRGREATVQYRAAPLPPQSPDEDPRELMAFDLALPGGIGELPFYLGPKAFDVLEAADPALPQSIEFGFLSWLVVPLHRSLSWVHAGVDNWGLAIIILTVLINIVIFPLRHKQVISARKMQEIQPEMKAIQERYKHLKATDPQKQKMNQEVMALYRERGVNPVSGCLPLLATMPILFAFFRLLSMATEMRGAPFMLWITDLSVHDPLYITPIIMGGSMVLQTWLTPAQVDPMQQKMMMAMPVVFTFMFLWAPSGLVIYWLTSNVLGIGQQVITNRVIGPPKVRTVRPPAERRVKKAARGGAAGRSATGG
ncbi:MAG: membrane protein insertase YidC [Acidobacteria bacterium]|nr:membrane protein insertase YidC [Acidobacteriota bacterium]MYI75955.1 membrane protein insertase YidC [Acidobacteriota bacterium]